MDGNNALIDNLDLFGHYKMWPRKIRVNLRNMIMARAGMGYTTFYNKMRDPRSFTPLEYDFIIDLLTETKKNIENGTI